MRNILELRAEQFTEAVTGPDAFAVISHCSQVPQCHCKQVIITNPRTGNPKFPQLCPASAGESMRARGWKMMRREHVEASKQLSRARV